MFEAGNVEARDCRSAEALVAATRMIRRKLCRGFLRRDGAFKLGLGIAAKRACVCLALEASF